MHSSQIPECMPPPRSMWFAPAELFAAANVQFAPANSSAHFSLFFLFSPVAPANPLFAPATMIGSKSCFHDFWVSYPIQSIFHGFNPYETWIFHGFSTLSL